MRPAVRPARLLAFACLLLFGASPAGAQEQETESRTVDDGYGGKITTTSYDWDGKHYVETVRRDAKGKLSEKRTDITGPNGTAVDIENYDFMGTEQVTSRHHSETDASGTTTMQTENWEKGTLVRGEITVKKSGETHYIVVKKWSLLKERYVDVPLAEQEKERAEWKKFDERLEKSRVEREKFFRLLKQGKVSFEPSGTGETIGHVADLAVKNLTNESLSFTVPPLVVECRSCSHQDYAVPEGETVALNPGETKNVPLSGTCLERDRPPEPPGPTRDIVLTDGEESSDLASHFDPWDVIEILREVEAKYRAADKLEEEGEYKDLPYHDKEEQKRIAVQWSTWEDPRISEVTYSPPVEREDFKQNIDQQADHGKKRTRDERKKIDAGTDALWEGIELTSEKAKDLEEGPGSGVVEVSDQTGDKTESPPPQTEEKKVKKIRTKEEQEKKEERKQNRQKWGDWKKKEKMLYAALAQKVLAQSKYNKALQAYLDKNDKYQAAKARRDAEAKKGNLLQNPDFADAAVNLTNIEVELEKEFQKTPDGKKAREELDTANKALEKADTEEKEAKQGILPSPKSVTPAN